MHRGGFHKLGQKIKNMANNVFFLQALDVKYQTIPRRRLYFLEKNVE